MNNFVKTIIGLGIGVAAYYAVKSYKKYLKEATCKSDELKKEFQKEENNAETKETSDVVESEEEENLNIDYEINLPKKLFHDCRFSSNNLPIDVVDTNKILSSNKLHVIHVTQSFDSKTNRNVLNFLFEIPKSAYIRNEGIRKFIDGNTTISDFVRSIKGVWDKDNNCLEKPGFQETMLELVKDPRYTDLKMVLKDGNYFHSSKTEPFAYLYYQELVDGKWVDKTRLTTLDRNIYENNPFNSDHSKATEFIQDLYKEYNNESSSNLKIGSSNDNYRNIEILDAFMAIRVSFNIQDACNLDGINSKSGLRILEKIYNDFNIESRSKGIFNYENFLFYTDDDNDVCVYVEEGKVIKDLPIYE